MPLTLSRILSPTTLLYTFVVISQFTYGLYLGAQTEPPSIFVLLDWICMLWIFGWWLRSDSRKRGVAPIYDLGLFLYVAWPIVLPYYLVKTRGTKGLLFILAFAAVWLGAAMLGAIVAAMISVW